MIKWKVKNIRMCQKRKGEKMGLWKPGYMNHIMFMPAKEQAEEDGSAGNIIASQVLISKVQVFSVPIIYMCRVCGFSSKVKSHSR